LENLMSAILEVSDISVRFGGVTALDGISFAVSAGDICGIIGPNGAGKTTLFNCLSRIYQPNSGTISFKGHALLDLPRQRMASLGIGRTFQNLALFKTMTVRQNIMVGGHSRSSGGFVAAAFQGRKFRAAETVLARHADELIDKLGLTALADHPIDGLTFATQKRVELARALAANPDLLLLDEPAGGLNHEEVEDLRALITSIRDQFGLTILLVEHHMNLVMRVSNQVIAIDFGQIIANGNPAEIQSDENVLRAYLGTSA
jgi:branched-chain amino acid transport system ATP-binding protein